FPRTRRDGNRNARSLRVQCESRDLAICPVRHRPNVSQSSGTSFAETCLATPGSKRQAQRSSSEWRCKMSTQELERGPAPVSGGGSFVRDPQGNEPLRADLHGRERLDGLARELAGAGGRVRVEPGRSLLRRFARNSRALIEAHRQIREAYHARENLGGEA